jgi:hypothetical protein
MKRFRDPQGWSHPQGHLDCRGTAPLAMTMDLIQIFSKLLAAE